MNDEIDAGSGGLHLAVRLSSCVRVCSMRSLKSCSKAVLPCPWVGRCVLRSSLRLRCSPVSHSTYGLTIASIAVWRSCLVRCPSVLRTSTSRPHTARSPTRPNFNPDIVVWRCAVSTPIPRASMWSGFSILSINLPSTSRKPPMNRLGRILKWTAIVAAVAIAIVLAINALLISTTGGRLERRLLELRHEGFPVQLADLAHEPIPDEKNADAYLRRAGNDLEALQKDLLGLYPKKGYTTGKLTADEQSRLKALFAKYPKLMPLVEQAANCPDSALQLDFRADNTVSPTLHGSNEPSPSAQSCVAYPLKLAALRRPH